MTVEAMPRSRSFNELDENQDATGERNSGVLVVGPGANTRNMLGALQQLESLGHEVHYAGFSTATPAFEIDNDRLHEVDTEEGHERILRMIGDRAFSSIYLSVPASAHAGLLLRYLPDVADGLVTRLVTTKPIVESREEIREVEAAKRLAEERLRERHGDDYDFERNPVIWVHEHYLTKGSWQAVREQLDELSGRLGRLRSATVDIQEARTAEDEGRAAVIAAGAFEDLGPHAMSLGLDVQDVINSNSNGRYRIAGKSDMDVSFVRHEGSEFPDGVETGFIIQGVTQVHDKESTRSHDLVFTWCGGKGLVDKKEVVLEFEDPETGDVSTVTADLRTNKVYVPDSVADLFTERQFQDNGYGESVTAGLNGGDPRKSFQTYDQAKTVTIWGSNLTAKGRAKGAPLLHPRGLSLQEIARALPS